MSAGTIPGTIYVDADACPVKPEIYKVAERHGVTVQVVAGGIGAAAGVVSWTLIRGLGSGQPVLPPVPCEEPPDPSSSPSSLLLHAASADAAA